MEHVYKRQHRRYRNGPSAAFRVNVYMYFMLITAVQTFKENEMNCTYPGWECWDVSSSSNSDLGMGWLGLPAWSKGMERGWIRYFWGVYFMTSSVLWNVFRVVLGHFLRVHSHVTATLTCKITKKFLPLRPDILCICQTITKATMWIIRLWLNTET